MAMSKFYYILYCIILRTKIESILSDKMFIKIQYAGLMGKPLNLNDPKTFNEKLNWLKLNDRKPLYTILVDKYRVKEYVSHKIGQQYVIPTLAVWNSIDEIDFDSLPDKFVLKTTHSGDSLGVVICKDKSTFNISEAKNELQKSLNIDYYKAGREWPYKNVPPRIIAEKYIEDGSGDLFDYKFFCFDGAVKALFVATDRSAGHVKFDYYDADFNHLNFVQSHPMSDKTISKPANFDLMKSIASNLSQGIPHVRVDLYNVNGIIYFGEMTFYNYGGCVAFHPEDWDYTFGSWLDLPTINSHNNE